MKRFSIEVLKCLAVLISAMYLISSPISVAFGEETPVILTDKRIYDVGDVIVFYGSGLDSEASYTLQIYHGDLVIHSIEFNAASEGLIPPDVCWNTSFSEPGTYVVKLLGPEGETLSETILGLVEINKLEFLPRDLLVILGGGAEPNGIVNIVIFTDSEVLFNISVIADDNGEFNAVIQLPFNITTGDYSVNLYIVGEAAPDITFQIFVNASVSNMMNVTASELEELIVLVSGMNVTIKQSLLVKLQNALKKIEQAEEHLLANRTHVAENMLNAAGNILNALLNEIQAQYGKHLDNETASYMNSAVQEIVKKLEITGSRLEKPDKNVKDNKQVIEGKVVVNEHGKAHENHQDNRESNRGKGHGKHGSSRGKGRS